MDVCRRLLVTIVLLIGILPGTGMPETLPNDSKPSDELGEQMVHKCLAGDEQLECLRLSGFSCAPTGNANRNGYSCYASIDGGCYRTKFGLKPGGWTSHDDWVHGECEARHELAKPAGVRMQYDELNAPDSILFQMFVAALFRDNVDQGQHGMGKAYIRPGANSATDYYQVTLYFASKYLEIEHEVHDTQIDMLCQDGKPRYSDSTLFEVMDRFDDIAIETYAKHLEVTKVDFAEDDKFDLDAALRGFPAAFSITVVATSGSLQDVKGFAARTCSEPFKRSFTTIG